jgi:protein TonB
VPVPTPSERRAHPRKRLDQLAYIGFGPDTGGVLLDVSEEGLRCQIVGAVVEGDRCHLKFSLPGRHSAIEADGQVVWSNRSRQGGGVRLVGLGPDARQELQQWIRDEIASGDLRKPAVAARTRSVGAVHVPKPGTPEPAAPAPAESIPANQPMLAWPEQTLPGEQTEGDLAAEIEAAVETTENANVLREEPAPLTADEHADAKPEPAAMAQPAERGRSVAEAAKAVATHAAAAHKPASQRAAPQAAVPKPAERRIPLTSFPVDSHKPRFTKASIVAGCAVAAIVALAFSGFNLANLFSGGETDTTIVAPAAVPPMPPAVAGLESPASPVPSSENASTGAANDAVDHLSRSAAPPNRTVPPTTNPAPNKIAANQPPQNSTAARTATRQQMALALPRPRLANPARPPVTAPEVPLAPAVPPALLLNMPALESRAAELPRPGAGYTPPQLLSQVEPVYSAMAKQARLQGTVRVNATVGTDGVPRSPVCVSGNNGLCQMALEALRKWRYQPASSGGQPVEAPVLVNFNFQLR